MLKNAVTIVNNVEDHTKSSFVCRSHIFVRDYLRVYESDGSMKYNVGQIWFWSNMDELTNNLNAILKIVYKKLMYTL